MKIKNIALTIIALTLCVCMSSCGRLSGTYACDDDYPNIDGRIYKIDFDGDKCTIYDHIILYSDMSYEIRDGKMYISGIWSSILGQSELSYEYEYSKEGNSIFLDGFEFKKSK